MIIFHVLNTYHAPGTVLSTIALKFPSKATQTREDETGFALRFARLQSLLFLAPSHDVTCQAGCETGKCFTLLGKFPLSKIWWW